MTDTKPLVDSAGDRSVVNPPSPGAKTSEFLIVLATLLASTALLHVGHITADQWEGLNEITCGLYIGGRSVVKLLPGLLAGLASRKVAA